MHTFSFPYILLASSAWQSLCKYSDAFGKFRVKINCYCIHFLFRTYCSLAQPDSLLANTLTPMRAGTFDTDLKRANPRCKFIVSDATSCKKTSLSNQIRGVAPVNLPVASSRGPGPATVPFGGGEFPRWPPHDEHPGARRRRARRQLPELCVLRDG